MERGAICNTADRLGLPANQVTALVSATLKAGEANLDTLIISRSTSRRNRTLSMYNITQSYMAEVKTLPTLLLYSGMGRCSETSWVVNLGPPQRL